MAETLGGMMELPVKSTKPGAHYGLLTKLTLQSLVFKVSFPVPLRPVKLTLLRQRVM